MKRINLGEFEEVVLLTQWTYGYRTSPTKPILNVDICCRWIAGSNYSVL